MKTSWTAIVLLASLVIQSAWAALPEPLESLKIAFDGCVSNALSTGNTSVSAINSQCQNERNALRAALPENVRAEFFAQLDEEVASKLTQ